MQSNEPQAHDFTEWPELKAFDQKLMKQMMANNLQFMTFALQKLVGSLEERLSLIDFALESGDVIAAADAIHAMAGQLGMAGSIKLRNYLIEFEENFRGGLSVSEAQIQFSLLRVTIEETVQEIKYLLAHR